MTIELVAQLVSILAMLFNILSYQGKKKSQVIFMQMLGAAFFGISYFLLGAVIGGILNIVAIVRSLVFLSGERLRSGSRLWLVAFGALYVAAYVLTFTVFMKEPTPKNLITEVLPVLAMLAITIGYSLKDAGAIRIVALVASPLWLAYNIFAMSLGGILCEAFSLVSAVVGILRLDKGHGKGANNSGGVK